MRSTFFCIDGHTCGNPVRVVAGGAPRLEGANMIERRAHFEREFDWIRTSLMFEPRGHEVMSGSILYPPTRDDCDVAIDAEFFAARLKRALALRNAASAFCTSALASLPLSG